MVSVRLGSGAQEASSVLKFRLAKASARAGGRADGRRECGVGDGVGRGEVEVNLA